MVIIKDSEKTQAKGGGKETFQNLMDLNWFRSKKKTITKRNKADNY